MRVSEFLYSFIQKLLGYVNLKLSPVSGAQPRSGINLNVGSGSYEINGFTSLDFYTKAYYPGKFRNRIHYDMRQDLLPFSADSVDNIYCSHVIEHIETEHVKRFFSEAYRTLKSGGCLRIVCPDFLFLYSNLMQTPDFFAWHPLYLETKDATRCFIDEVATHRSDLPDFGLEKELSEIHCEDLMSLLRQGGVFDPDWPGRHINNWSFERIKTIGLGAGFNLIVESRNRASSSPTMQGPDMDLTRPEMSLYVDLIK